MVKIRKTVGAVDILVNNAQSSVVTMCEMSVRVRKVIDVDLIAPFMVQAVIPDMIHKGHSKIINICSIMSELGREVFQPTRR